MTNPGEHPEAELLLLLELIEGSAEIAGDVAEIDDGVWAIHGQIPVDRDVIMAEFGTYDQARSVLDHLRASPRDSGPPSAAPLG